MQGEQTAFHTAKYGDLFLALGDLSNRTAGFIIAAYANYNVTAKLSLSFWDGYNYRNYKNYGIPRGTPR